MSAYHQAGFTIDPLHPIGEDPPPALGVNEYGNDGEIAERSEEYVELVAGPLRLSCEDSGMTLTATVEGADDASRVVIDWGDGELTEDETSAEHVYRMQGTYTVAAHATIEEVDYAVAKTRVMGSSPDAAE